MVGDAHPIYDLLAVTLIGDCSSMRSNQYQNPNRMVFLAVVFCWLGGCGGGSQEPGPVLEPVKGRVYLDNKPLANADVTFFPIGETPGIGGQTRTDGEGNFEVHYGRGGQGLPMGKYKVAVSVRVMPDGTPAPPEADVNPIESQGRETLPAKYSNIEKTKLEVTTEPGKPIVLKLPK